MPKTMFDKIWDAHEVVRGLLYIDLHLVHEVTSPQAFEGLRLNGRTVRRPDRTLATADHNTPTDGTRGHVVEFAGVPVEGISMEGRMTICNMTIEGGGRAGMIAPDETTFAWLEERGVEIDPAWRELATDDGAEFDREITIDASAL